MGKINSQAIQLPVRPAMRQDEWFETYLARLAHANGIKRPWQKDLQHIRSKVKFSGRHSVSGEPGYGENVLPEWAAPGKSPEIRYCPACLEASRHIRARWRLGMVEVCTIHNLFLKSGLCEPAFTAKYKHGGKQEIEKITSEEIWSDATCPIPLEKAYAHAIWSEFEQAAAGLTDVPPEVPLAWALLAEKLLEAVVTSVRGDEYPKRDVPRTIHRARWLAKIGMTLSASQQGVVAFLVGLTLSAHRLAVSRCLQTIMAAETSEPTLLSRLPLPYLHDRLRAAAPEAQKPNYCGALPQVKHPANHVSLEETEKLLGCSISFLTQLLQLKLFTLHKIKDGKKVYTFIPRAEIEACRRWLASCMTREEVMQRLQIGFVEYDILLKAGLIEPIKVGNWCRYYRDDIEQLLNHLENVALPYTAKQLHAQPLMGEWISRKAFIRSEVACVVEQIWRGDIPVYRKLNKPGLTGFYVDITALWQARWRSGVHRFEANGRQAGESQLSLLDAMA